MNAHVIKKIIFIVLAFCTSLSFAESVEQTTLLKAPREQSVGAFAWA